MLFKAYFFMLGMGTAGVMYNLTVFLHKYSDATSTEVGTLMMIVSFLTVFTKPYFCALTDRHQRYRLYFVLALLLMTLGFGSFVIFPFVPNFVAEHGRLCWYLLTTLLVIAYISYGVIWSLGDAYAANVAHKRGQSYGMIRMWGTVGWGFSGAFIGAVAPYLELPEMVFGLLVFIVIMLAAVALICWWPNKEDFVMGDAVPSHGLESGPGSPVAPRHHQQATITEKPSSQLEVAQLPAVPEVTPPPSLAEFELSLKEMKAGELSIRRTQSNSLAITTKVKLEAHHMTGDQLDRTIRELVKGQQRKVDRKEADEIGNLQTLLFMTILRRHKSLFKYLALFVALGTVYNIHCMYFFLHLEKLASEGKGADFATLSGVCLVAQSIGETLCFIIAPWVCKKLGRDGVISLNAFAYAARYLSNGLLIPTVSPFIAVVTESMQGINYGIFYYLVTDTALYYALLVEEVIPELMERKLIDKGADLSKLKNSLRVTMQGVFSGTFDGLGFGLGSLIAGLILESHSYEQLWCYTGTAGLIIFLLHAAYELVNRCVRRAMSRRHQRPGILESKLSNDSI